MRSVEINEKTVVKRDAPPRLRVEVEKTRRGGDIGRATGLFRVPRLLEYNEAAGQATFERIEGLCMVRDVLARRPGAELAERLGQALAAIHRDLELPEPMKHPLPEEFCLPGETEVFIHGDFTVENVYVTGPGEPLVILDWQMTDVHGEEATWGTRYFDVTWFINTLFYRPMHLYLGAEREAPWAGLFLRSYFAAAGCGDPEALRRYMERFFAVKMAQRRRTLSWPRRFLMATANARLRAFVRSFRL